MHLSNVVIPDIWIIEEELRKERERRRRKEELPLEHPDSLPYNDDERYKQDHSPKDQEERVAIIDL